MSNILLRVLDRIADTLNQPQKHRAIRSYGQRLCRLLQAKYGEQATYTPNQVKATVKEWGYSTSYDCYALAMYCDLIEFDDYHRSINESCNYELMRGEIGNCLFGADVEFSIPSLIEANFQFDTHDHSSTSGHAQIETHSHHDYGGSADAGSHSHSIDCGSSFDGGGCGGGGGY